MKHMDMMIRSSGVNASSTLGRGAIPLPFHPLFPLALLMASDSEPPKFFFSCRCSQVSFSAFWTLNHLWLKTIFHACELCFFFPISLYKCCMLISWGNKPVAWQTCIVPLVPTLLFLSSPLLSSPSIMANDSETYHLWFIFLTSDARTLVLQCIFIHQNINHCEHRVP